MVGCNMLVHWQKKCSLFFVIAITIILILYLEKSSKCSMYSLNNRNITKYTFGGFGRTTTTSRKLNRMIDKLFTVNSRTVRDVNCRNLIEKEDSYMRNYVQTTHDQFTSFDTITENCAEFVRSRGYINDPLTEEEEQFPIAFSILVFKDIVQAERLLRSIYRPQHHFCIHHDVKSSEEFKKRLAAITNCFPNVFIAPRSVDVQWGTYTVLEPELICLEFLWKFKKWKYFINLTGQEFPLKTNYELVKILKAYNGANDLESTVKRANSDRWISAGKPPHNIRTVKGSVHMVINREFVDYVLHNQTAIDLLEWMKKTSVPDESYFPTLNHNPHLRIPGSYMGEPETSDSKPFLARYKQWYGIKCAGKTVHGICIFGVGDLPRLTKAKHLFANKFHFDYQPVTYDCLEEWNFNRTRDYYYGELHFDDSYYKNLGFVKNKVS